MAGLLALAIVAVVWLGAGSLGVQAPTPAAPTVPVASPLESAGVALADRVIAALADPPPAGAGQGELLAQPAGPTYVALRRGGLRIADGWGDAATGETALRTAIAAASAMVAAADLAAIDTVEITLGASPRPLDLVSEDPLLNNLNRGLLGISLEHAGETVRFASSEMIARNLSFENALLDAALQLRIAPAALRAEGRAEGFTGPQFLVLLDPLRAQSMIRGNTLVEPDAVTADGVRALADGLSDWLVRQVGPDGRMTYTYWPSRGEESGDNNAIRQWMATIALGRLAQRSGDPGLAAASRRNVEYNLATFYRPDGERGLIVDPDGEVKLGAIALAALALIERPDRADFAEQEAALRRSVDSLWNPDGSFRTFLAPADRNDNQNFYPGEALVMWAALLHDQPDPALQARFLQSFRYYRDWHRAQRNPAFVPWHTQAYVSLWRDTGGPDLAAFVLEMNDWLAGFQQWDDAPAPDLRGRFYDPDHPEYGPPHASSDGVYLEGLIAAWGLAQDLGDTARAETYRVAINRALRNAMQLQFADDVDMFYVSRRDRVEGGMRTTVYDNEIRVDNVQHVLMGVLKVLDSFAAGDYRLE